MKQILVCLVLVNLFTAGSIVYAVDGADTHRSPVKETVTLRLEAGKNFTTLDDIQKMFTAVTISSLKNNNSYILGYEIYRARNRQRLPSTLVVKELDYEDFTITSIRYGFSNGYFEFKLSQIPFTNIINGEAVSSIDYNKKVDRALYTQINNRLQEAVYISRGYAARRGRKSSASFYWFK